MNRGRRGGVERRARRIKKMQTPLAEGSKTHVIPSIPHELTNGFPLPEEIYLNISYAMVFMMYFPIRASEV